MNLGEAVLGNQAFYVPNIAEVGTLVPNATTPTYAYQGQYFDPGGYLRPPWQVQVKTPFEQQLDALYAQAAPQIGSSQAPAEDILTSIFPGFQMPFGSLAIGESPAREAGARARDLEMRMSDPRLWFNTWAMAAAQQPGTGLGPITERTVAAPTTSEGFNFQQPAGSAAGPQQAGGGMPTNVSLPSNVRAAQPPSMPAGGTQPLTSVFGQGISSPPASARGGNQLPPEVIARLRPLLPLLARLTMGGDLGLRQQ